MTDVILQNITKTYNKGAVTAVKGVTFEVARGELFGLIGPDGAGKTSIFRILTTLLLPDGGTASVRGCDVVRDYKTIRRKVGYMPGKFSLYPDLSVEENLTFFATLFQTTVADNYEMVRDIYEQLAPFKNRRAGKLSGGMKQKLALCCALIHRPEVLFLDEPTTGVDVVSRKEFWDILQRLRQQGITILVATPYMDEATLCERIALMQNGSIMSIASPDEIVRRFPDRLFAAKAKDMGRLLRDLRADSKVKSCYSFGEYHHLTLQDQKERLTDALLQDLQQLGHRHVTLKPVHPGIEDCFIRLMAERPEPENQDRK